MDAGSLNGTILNGMVVSKDNRQLGDKVPLADEDQVEFGSITRARVRCQPSFTDRKLHTTGTKHLPATLCDKMSCSTGCGDSTCLPGWGQSTEVSYCSAGVINKVINKVAKLTKLKQSA